MLLKHTISRTPETDPALDQAQLYALGLDHVRRLSGVLWTDHNTHDPGITILELLCYALTDLAYRAQFPIEDLLATPDNAAHMAEQFFTPRQVLPNRALTVTDYRKLLIDLPGVKNAWISPAPQRCYADTAAAKLRPDDPGTPGIRPVDLRGLYRVRIEYMDSVTTKAKREEVDANAQTMLQANRNLCEDFVEVIGIETQFYSLCAEIELTLDANPIEVAAQLLFQVDQYLAPPIHKYTLDEMRAKRHEDGSAYTVQEIFEGPRLENGFLDDAELTRAELRTDVRLSDIISAIMHIAGVLAVRDIIVNALQQEPDGTPVEPAAPIEPENKWHLPVPDGKQPRLCLLEKHGRLVFYKRNLSLRPDRSEVDKRLGILKSEQRARVTDKRNRLQDAEAEDLPIPLGRHRDTARYLSVQQHFPMVYGLSDEGLPANVDTQRRVQALQLRGYLLFFDQVLANFCAQLAHVRELFSREPGAARTYFAQIVSFFRDAHRDAPPIYPPEPGEPGGKTVKDQLAELLEVGGGDAALLRRSRFLDHLLARFAEDFHHYTGIMRSAFGDSVEKTLDIKCAFLQDYPQQGGERGLAYNQSLAPPATLWNSFNVSGLERRLARLLGISNISRRNLGAVSYDAYAELDKTPGDEFRFRVKHPVSGKILLSSSKHYATREAARAEMEQALTLAQRRESCERKTTVDGKHYFNIIDGTGEVVARRIEYFATPEALEAAIDELVTHLREHYSGEGLYLIENMLLRPQQQDDPFLPICVDPACTDCADDDPYSYRLHFILPAYAGRFHNLDFRRFVEETIRLETPAHILPKICWVDADDMAKFEQAYRDWLTLSPNLPAVRRQEQLRVLIDRLYAVKNVYPKQKLHDCGHGNAQPPFIVGRTALGSEE